MGIVELDKRASIATEIKVHSLYESGKTSAEDIRTEINKKLKIVRIMSGIGMIIVLAVSGVCIWWIEKCVSAPYHQWDEMIKRETYF